MKALSLACTVVGASALAGCSLLYNPNNLPQVAVDAPTIVTPELLKLDAAGPGKLFEGQGTGGSRTAILAITGSNIAPDATVALVPVDAQSPALMINVDNEHAVRSPSGTSIAVPVTLPVDTSRAGTPDMCKVALTIQVTQMGSAGQVSQPLPDQVSLCNLPELDAPITPPITDSTMLAPLYSRVNLPVTLLPAGLVFAARANALPVVIRAVGSIVLGDVHVDASGSTPGLGGGAGGNAGDGITGAGTTAGGGPRGGAAGGLAKGGGGGLISTDDLIPSLATSGSGGGGGGVSAGGGGGGALEITAGGTLVVGAISSNGKPGGSANTLVGGSGGGSGGAIILRSGAPAMFGAITAGGGSGGAGGGLLMAPAGGNGGEGRVRYDAPSPFIPPAMMPSLVRRGAAFETSAETNPLVTTDRSQAFNVISMVSAVASTNIFDAFVFDASNTSTAMVTFTFVTASSAFSPGLTTGYNRVCVTPHGRNPLVDVAVTNCIDIAYVP